MANVSKPPVWFWAVSILALLWNAMGVMAYLTMTFATDERIANMPPEQQNAFLIEYPAWVTAAFALAVFSGFLGCVAFVFKKKWATTLFIVSAITALSQHIYIFMNVEVTDYVMPVMVIIICIFLIWFSKLSASKGWIS